MHNFFASMGFAVKFLLLLAAFVAFSSVHGSKVASNGENGVNFKELALKDRLLLLIGSKLKPKLFEHIPKEAFTGLFDETYPYPYIDNFFVDGRQLFTQSKNIAEDANLPEIDWRYRYSFCFWTICIDEELALTTKDSKFIGTENIISTTNVTPTTIENTFKVPFFNWTSSGFLFKITDYQGERIWRDENAFISFENVEIALKANYEFVPEVGIQVSKIFIYFNPGRVRGWVRDISQWDFEGNLLETYEPEEYPYDEIMTETWGYYKREFTASLEHSLNCLLSNGRSDPGNCWQDDGDISGDYFQFVTVQLLQTLGLGALLSS